MVAAMAVPAVVGPLIVTAVYLTNGWVVPAYLLTIAALLTTAFIHDFMLRGAK